MGMRHRLSFDLLRAETEHASARLLAGPLLTIGSKRHSAGFSRGFRSVALPAVWARLPFSASTGTEASAVVAEQALA